MKAASVTLSLLICAAIPALAGCGASTDAQPSVGTELRDGPSPAFVDAQQAIDESVFTIQQAEDFEWPVLRERLVDLAGYIDPQAMTVAERQAIDTYAADAGIDLEQQLALLQTEVEFPGIEYGSGGVCYTRCMGFLEVACENSQVVGICAGLWGCNAGWGAHDCMETPDSNPDQNACNGEYCQPGWRCARWAFKADECVQECDSNSDCPSGQKCKKPFGTSFHRCK